MSTDTPTPEDGQTPEEELQAATPEAPDSEPIVAEVEAAAEPEAVAESESEAAEPEVAAEADSGAEAPADGSDLPELSLGEGAPAEEDKPAAPVVIRGKIDKDGTAIGTGRRKTAVARVRIKEGDGKFVVNGRTLEEFFRIERDQKMVQAPLNATNTRTDVDVWVRVNGGGTTGQTGAVILGIARALEARNPELHHSLAEAGFLTRDGRMVERKKFGRRKARRGFQFSKR